MEIKDLKHTSIDDIVACLSVAFQHYHVQLPSDVAYWDVRFRNARLDKALSWGVFDQGRLVAFVLNAVDRDSGVMTAYNTGTGVIPEYRGQHLVDRMYDFGIPQLRKNGVTRCTLEVITANAKAIRVYERIGFKIIRTLKCYQGTLSGSDTVTLQETGLKELLLPDNDPQYSWDHKAKTITTAEKSYKAYRVFPKGSKEPSGYFIVNPDNGYLAQLDAREENWPALFKGIGQLHSSIKINNVDQARVGLIDYLQHAGIENTIDQYEMELWI